MIFIMTVLVLIICSGSVSSNPHTYSNLEHKSSVEKTGKGEENYKTHPSNQPTKQKKTKKQQQQQTKTNHTTHIEKLYTSPTYNYGNFLFGFC